MPKCAYFSCPEFIEFEDDLDGFIFCPWHTSYLDKMIEMDNEDDNMMAVLSYCFSALNNKRYEQRIQ